MTLANFTPGAGSNGVTRTPTISAAFSHVLDAATLNTATFSLIDTVSGARETSTVMVQGTSTAVLVPPDALRPLTRFQARLGSGIASTSGNTFAGFDWFFTTRDSQWDADHRPIANNVVDTALGLDAAGNAMTIAILSANQRSFVQYAAWMHATDALGSSGGNIGDGQGDIGQIALSVNGAGRAVALWTQFNGIQGNGTRTDAFVNIGSTTGAWGTATRVDTIDLSSAMWPDVVADAAGNAIAVWEQSVSDQDPQKTIWYTRFNATTGVWSPAQHAVSGGNADASRPHMAVDTAGRVLLVWAQNGQINSRRWDTATNSWGTRTLITTPVVQGEVAGEPRVAMTPSGDAVAVWSRTSAGAGTRTDIWFSRFSGATGAWSGPALVETTDVGPASKPQVAMDALGNAFATWEQSNNVIPTIYVNRMRAATGTWGTESRINAGTPSAAFVPKIAADPRGNALVTWSQQTAANRTDIWAARFTFSGAQWGLPRPIETEDGGPATDPRIAMDARGRGFALFQSNFGQGSYRAAFNRFR